MTRSNRTRSRSCFPGCFVTLFLLLVFVLVVLHFTAPVIIASAANKALPEQLNTEASLEDVHLNLLTGSFGLDKLVIQQPEGFEGDPLLNLRSLDIKLPVGKAVRQNPVVVRDLHLDGLDFRLVTDTNGVANVSRLGPKEPAPEQEKGAEPGPPPPVWLQHALLENITFTLRDLAKEWDLKVEDIRLEIKDLRIGHESPSGPARVELDLSLPGEKATGQLVVRARVGSIYPDRPDQTPPLQLAIGLFGFDLDFIDPFLVKGARSAVRGTGLEFEMFLEIHPGDTLADQTLSGPFVLTSDGGLKIDAKNTGTLAKPKLPVLSLMGDLLGNQFGRVTKLGGNIAQGGVEAGKTVLKTGGAAVAGAGKTVAKFGSGLFKTAKGVVTLDASEAKKGLSDATVGTVGQAVDTVGKTAGTAAKGLGDTAKVATGGDNQERWWNEVDQRAAAFERKVDTWFENNPFPPGTVKEASTPVPTATQAAPEEEPRDPDPTATPEPAPTATPEPEPKPEPEAEAEAEAEPSKEAEAVNVEEVEESVGDEASLKEDTSPNTED